MKVLVTGATGLIGSYLAEALLEEGYEVRTLVRRSSDLSDLPTREVELAYGDMADRDSLERAVRGVSVVFHAAARMNDWGPWQPFYEQNVLGTEHLLEASLREGVDRFVHTSSTGVVGLGHFMDADESHPFEPEGNYELSKVEQEKLALRYGREKGLPVTIIRPCWTLGPRARRHVPLLMQYTQRKQLVVAGRGNNVMSSVDARDVARAMILAARSDRAVGQTYNITNDSRTDTQYDIYRIVAEEMGMAPPRIHIPIGLTLPVAWAMEKWATVFNWDDAPMITPVRLKFVGRNRHFSCDKAKRELGYAPRIPLRQALREGVAWAQGRPGGALLQPALA